MNVKINNVLHLFSSLAYKEMKTRQSDDGSKWLPLLTIFLISIFIHHIFVFHVQRNAKKKKIKVTYCVQTKSWRLLCFEEYFIYFLESYVKFREMIRYDYLYEKKMLMKQKYVNMTRNTQMIDTCTSQSLYVHTQYMKPFCL